MPYAAVTQSPLPSMTHYHKDNKDLYYVAASHGTEVGNATHETIRRAIAAYKPQLVIVEGTPTEDGLSPARNLDFIRDAAADGFRHVYEPVYTAYLAEKEHIPFTGGEPSAADVYATMRAEGYSARDVMAHRLLRLIPELRSDGVLDEAHFDRQATQILQGDGDPYFDLIPKAQRLNFADFNAWYAAHDTSGKPALAATARDTDPYSDKDATYFQAMSHVIDKIRDRHLDQIISGALKGADRVMVVYGNAHLYTSRPVLEKMFGGKGEQVQIPQTSAPPLPPMPDPAAPVVAPIPPAPASPRDDSTARAFRSVGLVFATLAAAAVVVACCITGSIAISPLAIILAAGSALSLGGSVVAEVAAPLRLRRRSRR
jgi:hypothetical protein